MKKLTSYLLITFLSFLFITAPVKAAREGKTVPLTSTKASETKDPDAQLARLEEIKAMDLSKLTHTEKKELRNEVLTIQNSQYERGRRGYARHDEGRHWGHHHGGVYLSFGAVLLILFLLIVLL